MFLLSVVFKVIVAVLVFGFLIFFHELGHFLAAKKSGVQVNEFSIGMGPALYQHTRGETCYSLRLFPIGGYVSMEGEDEDSSSQRAFCNARPLKRFVILAAGASMNLLLGYLIMFSLVLMGNGIATTQIHSFEEGAQSAQFLQAGDRIVGLNGSRVRTANDISFELMRDSDGCMDVDLIRDGEKVHVPDAQFGMVELPDGQKAVKLDFIVTGVPKTFLNVPVYALDWTISIVKQVWVSFVDLVTGQYQLNQLSGPVGVAAVIGEASTQGLENFLIMVAIITVNLGVFNLMPLPALDGGRLVFLLIEAVRGRPVNPKVEGFVNVAGLAALMVLMIYVTFNDILKLF